MKNNRNDVIVHIGALLLIAALVAITISALTDERAGLSIFDASLEERVSRAYLLKSVSLPHQEETIRVVPGTAGYENGAANIVTAVVTDYRILDTLGEIIVLFASAAGVSLLMGQRRRKEYTPASGIVETAVPIIMVFAVVVGLYIILHGHLTPGGGFPGGAVIASAFIIGTLAFKKSAPKPLFKVLESGAGLTLLLLGFIGLYVEGSFFANFLPTGVLGNVFSAPLIMIVYAVIGIKVAAELSSISGEFIGE
jgi:multicomponent Na+:H+ antiporter subunit B